MLLFLEHTQPLSHCKHYRLPPSAKSIRAFKINKFIKIQKQDNASGKNKNGNEDRDDNKEKEDGNDDKEDENDKDNKKDNDDDRSCKCGGYRFGHSCSLIIQIGK